MNELIKVTINENDEQLVSGRDLHKFLEVTERYSTWFERMLKYGFTENIDFTGCKVFNTLARQELQDHALKLDMAKEISMIQRSEKGKQARQYFLKVERAWNNPEMVVQRALQIQTRKVEALELENNELKPKALFADAVDASKTSILIGDLAKIIKQNGYNIGQNRLFQWLRDNGYLIARKGDSYNMPTQRSLDLGVAEIKERTHNNPDGSIRISRTPKITGKGQIYFVNKFLNEVS
ncbi:phage antirepressor KilAC domain-containing protein [Enterococcus hulanensis]|uniref:phage antirepressor KilAC domain-containing protein n=1 Tax=Enterococcus TaxID=1350 RepID=UPI000B5A5242|nr:MULTISPECIES: phage antirepressor KilAC domain-containing protein [Enterococcus]MBO0412459.1 phage antirepressor KilAC domain-containing protein [Enterococcus hulanensis]OTO15156.1 hypothetical protein A5875_004313 [Enterococcus sp. 3H8_DIV0648]